MEEMPPPGPPALFSPGYSVLEFFGSLVINGDGHSRVSVKGELHIVADLGFADFLARGLHFLCAPGKSQRETELTLDPESP